MPKAKTKGWLEENLYWLAPDVDPNVVTGLSVLAMLGAAFYVVRHEVVLAGALVLLSGFLDVLDGTIARKYKRQTRFGAFLDRVSDRVNDSIILASIAFASLVPLSVGLFTLALVLTASYSSAVIDSLSRVKRAEALSTRWLRILLIAGGLLLNQVNSATLAVLAVAFYSFLERCWAATRLEK